MKGDIRLLNFPISCDLRGYCVSFEFEFVSAESTNWASIVYLFRLQESLRKQKYNFFFNCDVDDNNNNQRKKSFGISEWSQKVVFQGTNEVIGSESTSHLSASYENHSNKKSLVKFVFETTLKMPCLNSISMWAFFQNLVQICLEVLNKVQRAWIRAPLYKCGVFDQISLSIPYLAT